MFARSHSTMPDYRYRALNMRGRIQNGTLAAETPRDLQLRLMQAGMTLIESRIHRPSGWRLLVQRGGLRDLAQFCQHVAQLERASVRLTDTLRDVTSSLPETKLRQQLLAVTHEVESGSSLSQALSTHPASFPPPMPSLIAAGEASGRLAESFTQLAAHYTWQAKLRSRLMRVLAYPLFALIAMVGVMLFLLAYVIPETAEFLYSMNVTLPGYSLALMAIAAFTVRYGIWLATCLAVLLAVLVFLYKRNAGFAYQMDRLALKLPLIGAFLGKLDLARFAKTLSMLLNSGIDLPPALQTAGGAVRNRAMIEQLDIVRAQVNNGNPLSLAAQLSGIFTPLITRMIVAGEESGGLPQAWKNIAEFYEDDVQHSAETIVSALGPIVTLVTGGLLIWLVLAVFLPIYDVLPKLM